MQYATTNKFKVLSTWYPRKDIHKGTWKIPGTEDTNQTDHILVSKRWATDIENIRTYRGANSDSDHFLVGAKLKQKIALITRNIIGNWKGWKIDKPDERGPSLSARDTKGAPRETTLKRYRRRMDTYKRSDNYISTKRNRRKTK